MSTMTMIHFACDICEAVKDTTKKIYKTIERNFISFGYARAAGELARYGRHEEAKSLIMQIKNL